MLRELKIFSICISLTLLATVSLAADLGANFTPLTQTQVSQLYVSIFGRASEGVGNAYWQSEQSDMAVAANTMLNTEPAKAYFGATLNDNQAFIEFIYENTLGKTYAEDPAGVNYWVSELTGGKSKGEVVATLINAAIDPQYAGLAAQDQFLNKVAVSNYTADHITTVPDVNDLSAFVNFISDVTGDDATVVAAKDAVDEQVDVIGVSDCDSDHLNLCTAEGSCLTAGGYWWSDNSCNSTPLPNDEQAIRDFYAEMKARIEVHDVDGFNELFAPDYMHNGEGFSDISASPTDLATVQTFNFIITNIIFISGNTAKVYGTCSVTFNDGSTSESWSEPDINDDSDGLGWIKKTGNDWMVLGNQMLAKASFSTGHNTTPGDDHYFFRARTTSSQPITNATFSGPNIPNTTLTLDTLFGDFTAFVTPSPLSPIGTEYTFTINFADGIQQILHDKVKSYVPTGPSITVTLGQGTATISWTDVSEAVPNADHYWVRVSNNGLYWESDDLPLSKSVAVFNENGMAQGVLESSKTYVAEVFIFNKSDDYAYQRLYFTMP